MILQFAMCIIYITTETEDYARLMQEITLEPQLTTVAVTIRILEDEVEEEDESFSVVLSAPVATVAISPDTATVTITDNDPGKRYTLPASNCTQYYDNL